MKAVVLALLVVPVMAQTNTGIWVMLTNPFRASIIDVATRPNPNGSGLTLDYAKTQELATLQNRVALLEATIKVPRLVQEVYRLQLPPSEYLLVPCGPATDTPPCILKRIPIRLPRLVAAGTMPIITIGGQVLLEVVPQSNIADYSLDWWWEAGFNSRLIIDLDRIPLDGFVVQIFYWVEPS